MLLLTVKGTCKLCRFIITGSCQVASTPRNVCTKFELNWLSHLCYKALTKMFIWPFAEENQRVLCYCLTTDLILCLQTNYLNPVLTKISWFYKLQGLLLRYNKTARSLKAMSVYSVIWPFFLWKNSHLIDKILSNLLSTCSN